MRSGGTRFSNWSPGEASTISTRTLYSDWLNTYSDPEICSNVLKSLLLNSLALMSIYFFDLLLAPLAQGDGQTKWLHRNVGWFYQILWLLPVLGVSFYLNVRVRQFGYVRTSKAHYHNF